MNKECSELGQDDRIPQAVEELRRRLQALLGENLLEVRLYGSWARGDAAPDSDVDLAVLVQRADLAVWQKVQEEAARLSLERDLVLSVRLLSQEEWEELQRLQTLYARRLKEEGIPL
jgi:predicted nucleotidyltransferase